MYVIDLKKLTGFQWDKWNADKSYQKHGITPKSIQKPIREKLIREASAKQGEGYQIQLSKWHSVSLDNIEVDSLTPQNKNQLKDKLTKAMHAEARHLNFELAAKLRDAIAKLTSE